MVEVVGHTGLFDYIEFAAEYAPWDLEGLDNFSRALELYNMAGMIKIDHEFEKMLTQRAIGSGFQSILFANVEDVERSEGVHRRRAADYAGGQAASTASSTAATRS